MLPHANSNNPNQMSLHGPILYCMQNEGFRIYDSEIAQWLNPAWEGVGSPNGGHLISPLQLFPYRFHNNDPVSAPEHDTLHQDANGKVNFLM